jgi:putative FmdB family regulatory protein
MPIYEYKCKHCNFISEKKYGINDDITVVHCEMCDHDAHRIMSVSASIVMGHNAANGYSKESEGL